MTLDERANLGATDYVASWGGGGGARHFATDRNDRFPRETRWALGLERGDGACRGAGPAGARARPRSALLQAHPDQLYRVWDGTGDGYWDVVLTETTEGRARLLATMSFDEWSGLSATQEAISIAGTEAEAEMALPAEDVERLLPPVGRIGD
jgi:hypothetical protein